MIFVTADTHGEPERFEDKQLKALKKGDTLIVLGDFGFIWNDDDKEKKLLAKLGKKPYRILFIDGASENFDAISRYPETVFSSARAREIVKDRIYYIHRGEILEMEGKKLLCFGGSDIVDPDLQTEHNAPSPADFENCAKNLSEGGKRADYVLTHIPSGKIHRFLNLDSHIFSETLDFFDILSDNVSYEKWYFGALHLDKYVSPKVQAVYTDVLPLWKEEKKKWFFGR